MKKIQPKQIKRMVKSIDINEEEDLEKYFRLSFDLSN